jgi:hypothetical protein
MPISSREGRCNKMHELRRRSNPSSLSSGNTYTIMKLLNEKCLHVSSDIKNTNFETPKDSQIDGIPK